VFGGIMESSEYRRLARNCLRLADNAAAASDRAMLIQMAQIWHRLAEEKERTEAQNQMPRHAGSGELEPPP
jgi:hypothetical protein